MPSDVATSELHQITSKHVCCAKSFEIRVLQVISNTMCCVILLRMYVKSLRNSCVVPWHQHSDVVPCHFEIHMLCHVTSKLICCVMSLKNVCVAPSHFITHMSYYGSSRVTSLCHIISKLIRCVKSFRNSCVSACHLKTHVLCHGTPKLVCCIMSFTLSQTCI